MNDTHQVFANEDDAILIDDDIKAIEINSRVIKYSLAYLFNRKT